MRLQVKPLYILMKVVLRMTCHAPMVMPRAENAVWVFTIGRRKGGSMLLERFWLAPC